MNMLFLDIETSPHEVYVWDLWKPVVALNQIKVPGRILCAAYKFEGDTRMSWVSCREGGDSAEYLVMLDHLHEALDTADVVVSFNGESFDIPWIDGELARVGHEPPSPIQHIDLYKTVKKRFFQASHKLEYQGMIFEIGQKVHTGGFKLWRECLDGDDKAWRKMERYNKNDVVMLERFYRRILPWIPNHPSRAAPGQVACPRCGDTSLQVLEYWHGTTRSYKRYRCTQCWGWLRATNSTRAKNHVVTSV